MLHSYADAMDQLFSSIANNGGGNNGGGNASPVFLQNQGGAELAQQQQMNMNIGQIQRQQIQGQQQQMNFMKPNGGVQSHMMNQNRRQSDGSILSLASVNDPAQTLLMMLADSNQQQNQNDPSGSGSQGQGSIDLNDASQQQQQLFMAMQQQQQPQPRHSILSPPQQNQIQTPQNQRMSPNQGQMQQDQSSVQANLAQMQQHVSQLPVPLNPQFIGQQQNRIQDFLSRHGRNLSNDQKLNLKNQMGGSVYDAVMKSMNLNMNGINNGGGGGENFNMGAPQHIGVNMNMMQQMLRNNIVQGNAPVPSMTDLMSRQRDQLRNLQGLIRPEDLANEQGGGQLGALTNNLQGMSQEQLAQFVMNFHMQQSQRNSQAQNNIQMLHAQGQGPNFLKENQEYQQQQSMFNSHEAQIQQLQQMQHRAQQQQNNSSQPRVSSAIIEHMIRRRQKQDQENILLQQVQHKRSQEQNPVNQNKQPKLSPPIPHSETLFNVASKNTRVVPIALSPRPGLKQGDISEAVLIYTKHVLNSIVMSLNSTHAGSGRMYTIRDLSTCLDAWDLTHPSTNHRKPDESYSNDVNDGNAETSFNFYYERSCPILLDAKGSTGSIPFSAVDFGEEESSDEDTPAVMGAVVLTFGADQKFTGGIGEEGVLTKAIFEFLYEPAVALGTELCDNDTELNHLLEAEEQLFARLDNEHSSFITAALHALSPTIEEEDNNLDGNKVYIPVIWSGNTNREYQYCLLGNFDDDGKELKSKRLCVAIQRKTSCSDEPSKGVCRITITLSPESVLAEKKRMANAFAGQNLNKSSSVIHRKIRQNLRCLRPPKLLSPSSVDDNIINSGKRRVNLRRPSMTHLIDPSLIVVGMRCKHELLLDTEEVGKVYINGSLVVDCSVSIPSSVGKNSANTNILCTLDLLRTDVLPSHTLFGIDFTFPTRNEAMFFHNLPDKATLEKEYGALLVDALIDATQFESDVAGKLLCRLISGKIEDIDNENDEDEKDKKGRSEFSPKTSFYDDDFDSSPSSTISFDDVSKQCIESIVLSKAITDPVGVGAKALSTKFRMHYGNEYFPCEIGTDDEYQLCKVLGPKKLPKAVPRRVCDILRRGGYLPLNKMARFIWGRSAASWDGDHDDSMRASEAMEGAIGLLRQAGCNDVESNMIRFVGRKQLEIADVSVSTLRCWYDAPSKTYFFNDSILFVDMKSQSGNQSSQNVSSVKIFDDSKVDNYVASDTDMEKDEEKSISIVDSNQGTDSSESDSQVEDKTAYDRKIKSEVKSDDVIENRICKNDELALKGTLENDLSNELYPGLEDISYVSDKGGDALIKSSYKHNDGPEDKDNMSLASSEKTDKATNSRKEDETKPKYRPTKEIAYLLALYIAREHPNSLLLEQIAICKTE